MFARPSVNLIFLLGVLCLFYGQRAAIAQPACTGIIALDGSCVPQAHAAAARRLSIAVATGNVAYVGSPVGFVGDEDGRFQRLTRGRVVEFNSPTNFTRLTPCPFTCPSPPSRRNATFSQFGTR